MNSTVSGKYDMAYAVRKIIAYQRKKSFAKHLVKKVSRKLFGRYNVGDYIDNGYYINPVYDTERDYDAVISMWKDFLDRDKYIVNILEEAIIVENIIIEKVCIVYSLEQNQQFANIGYVDSEGSWKEAKISMREYMKKISFVEKITKLAYNVITIL